MQGRSICRGVAIACWLTVVWGYAQLAAASGPPSSTSSPDGDGCAGGSAIAPKITGLVIQELAALKRPRGSALPRSVRFELTVQGQSLVSCAGTPPAVAFDTQDPGQPVEGASVTGFTPKAVRIRGEARVGVVITSVTVTDRCPPPKPASTAPAAPVAAPADAVPGTPPPPPAAPPATPGTPLPAAAGSGAIPRPRSCTAVTHQQDDAKKKTACAEPPKSATSEGLSILIKAIPPDSMLQTFVMSFVPAQSKEFPNLHSLLLTKESGEAGVGFASNPNLMRIDLEPTGATDLDVVQSNEDRLDLHYVAAEGYTPTNVVVTVYSSTDLDRRRARFVGKVAPAPAQAGPTSASGPPPANAGSTTASGASPASGASAPGSDASGATASKSGAKGGSAAQSITSVETIFLDRHDGNGRIRIYGKGFGRPAAPPPFAVDAFLCDCLERPSPAGPPWRQVCGQFSEKFEDPAAEGMGDRTKLLADQSRARQAYCGVGDDGAVAGGPLDRWQQWQCGMPATVSVYGRNPSIRVERAEIIDMNDEMVDVYFEFTRHAGYAWPFRLAGVDLTVSTQGKQALQVVTSSAAAATAEVDATTTGVVHLSSAIGPAPDENLSYRYTVLADDEVARLLGDGIKDNFHVVEVSVVNDGAKKVQVPLAGMQAEVEWLYGEVKKPLVTSSSDGAFHRVAANDFFLEGPATLAPVPMPTVSAYFGASKKNGERRVKTFNILEGITTLVGALIPFAGVGLKNGEVVFSSGFIPGLRHAWGDLTDQQLQNLTALSWQTAETLAANGGSVEKLVYIQKGVGFADGKEAVFSPPRTTRQQLSNIVGFEVVGYEVNDSPAKQATPAGKSPASVKPGKTSTTSSKTSSTGAATTVTTTTESTPPGS